MCRIARYCVHGALLKANGALECLCNFRIYIMSYLTPTCYTYIPHANILFTHMQHTTHANIIDDILINVPNSFSNKLNLSCLPNINQNLLVLHHHSYFCFSVMVALCWVLVCLCVCCVGKCTAESIIVVGVLAQHCNTIINDWEKNTCNTPSQKGS